MKVINAISFLIVWVLWRIYRIGDIFDFHFSQLRDGQSGVVNVIHGEQLKLYKNAAVVVATYDQIFDGSTIKLLRALRANHFDIYFVWNGALPASVLDQARSECVEIIQRVRRGFDWAGYKYVFNRLAEEKLYEEAGLFISNDSFYYFDEMGAHIAKLLTLEGDVKGFILNKEIYPHLVGANLYLTSRARQNPKVMEFWSKFKPTWDKRTTIFKGEIEHFRAIGEANLKVSVLTSSLIEDNSKLSKIALDYSERIGLRRPNEKGLGVMETTAAIRHLGEVFETRSILHVIGPFLTKYWGLPLKLDLIKWPATKWSTLEITSILRDSPYVAPGDLKNLEMHFGVKNSWASIDSQMAKLFANFGFFK